MKAKSKSNGIAAPQGGTPRDRIGQTPAGAPAAAPKATGLWRDHASIDLGVSDVMWTLYPDLYGLEVTRIECCTAGDLTRRVRDPSHGKVYRRARKRASAGLATSVRDKIILVWAKEPSPDVAGVRDTRSAPKVYLHARHYSCRRMAPIDGCTTVLIVERIRWMKEGRTFREERNYHSKFRSVTAGAKDLAERCLAKTNSHAAAMLSGLSRQQVRACLDDLKARVELPLTTIHPEVLMVDQKYFDRKRRIKVLANAETGKLWDLIPRDNEENFRSWLRKHLECNRRLKAVVGDLCKSQRRIIYEESEGSLLYVADRRHVTALANGQVQRLRKRLLHEAGVSARTGRMAGLKAAIDTPLGQLSADQQELMAAVRNRWPLLWREVHVKEGVFQFYEAPTLSAAEEALRQWISGLTREDRVVFKLFLKSLRDWRTEILNYWRVVLPGAEPGGPPRRVTNGAIEARNNQLAICYAASRGWDRGRGKGGSGSDESRGFQRFRTEMLLRYGESNPDED